MDSVTAMVEEGSAKVTKLIRVAGGALVLILATGSTVIVLVQEQIDNLKNRGTQLEQDARDAFLRSETNQQRIERLRAELAQSEAQGNATSRVLTEQVKEAQASASDAEGKADVAEEKADRKQPPEVIDRTVTVTRVSPGSPSPSALPPAPRPSPSPTPTPTKPPGLGLPPLFPDVKE